jgi:Kef-type K+ transport system membrane component KefB
VVSIEHFEEYFLFGLFFAVLGPLQILWGVAAYRWPRRDVLAVGAAASLAVVALWIASRTVGLPIGPEPGQPEAVGVVDVLSSADEVALALLVVALLKLRDGTLRLSPRTLRIAASGGAYVLMVGSLVALLLGAHHHGA